MTEAGPFRRTASCLSAAASVLVQGLACSPLFGLLTLAGATVERFEWPGGPPVPACVEPAEEDWLPLKSVSVGGVLRSWKGPRDSLYRVRDESGGTVRLGIVDTSGQIATAAARTHREAARAAPWAGSTLHVVNKVTSRAVASVRGFTVPRTQGGTVCRLGQSAGGILTTPPEAGAIAGVLLFADGYVGGFFVPGSRGVIRLQPADSLRGRIDTRRGASSRYQDMAIVAIAAKAAGDRFAAGADDFRLMADEPTEEGAFELRGLPTDSSKFVLLTFRAGVLRGASEFDRQRQRNLGEEIAVHRLGVSSVSAVLHREASDTSAVVQLVRLRQGATMEEYKVGPLAPFLTFPLRLESGLAARSGLPSGWYEFSMDERRHGPSFYLGYGHRDLGEIGAPNVLAISIDNLGGSGSLTWMEHPASTAAEPDPVFGWQPIEEGAVSLWLPPDVSRASGRIDAAGRVSEEFSWNAGDPMHLTIRMQRGIEIPGHVLAPDGVDRRRAVVEIFGPGAGAGGVRFPSDVADVPATGASGEFTAIVADSGSYVGRATLPGYIAAEVEFEVSHGRGPARMVRFELEPEAIMLGSARNSEGRPAHGVQIQASVSRPDEPVLDPSQRSFIADFLGGETPWLAETGPDGEFRIEGLPPGPVWIVTHAFGTAAEITEHVLHSGENTVDLRLRAASIRLFGRLTGLPDDLDASVTISAPGSNPRRIPVRGSLFEIDGLSPGEVTLMAFADGHTAQPLTLRLDADDRFLDVTLAMEPENAVVEGRITGAGPSALVHADSIVAGYRRQTLAEDGSFRFEGLASGTWRFDLVQSSSRQVLGEVGLAAGEHRELAFDVSSRPRIRGLTNARPGSKVVLVHQYGTAVSNGVVDAAGGFLATAPAPGTYEIIWFDAGDAGQPTRHRQTVEIGPGSTMLDLRPSSRPE